MRFSLLIVLSKLLNAIPHFIRVFMGAALGWLGFHVIRFRRRVVLDNLRQAFRGEKSESEIRRIASRNFRHYGLTLVEVLQSVGWHQKDYAREVPVEGLDNLRNALGKGQGVYALNCHLGNWEWVIGSVVSNGIAADVVVKHSKNEDLDRFLRWYRENMGIGIFYESGTVKDILSSLSKGRLVGFVLDQFMGPPIGLPVRFFGHTAGTAIGLALLTERRAAPIVPMYSIRRENNRLVTIVEPEVVLPEFSKNREDRLYEKTQFFNDRIELCVRKYPDHWLWLHRRWKAYRGEPRWKPSTGLASSLVALLIALTISCTASLPQETPTGILVPPDPTVGLPEGAEPQAPVKQPPARGKRAKRKHASKEIPPTPEPLKKFSIKTFVSAQLPFDVGERMTIALNWTAIPAGEVKLEVREGFPMMGRPTFRLWGSVLSSSVVDTIYHVDNTIESYVDKEWLLPYKFLLHMVETAQLKETRAAFDHKVNRVHYWSKRISKKWGDEVQDRTDLLNPRAIDMFSALYFARLLNFEKGKPSDFTVYENKQNLTVSLFPVGNEFVQTRAGAFQCWKLGVTVKIDNVLKPTGDMFLWLSDDFKKYIVKFDAKLKIGSLRGELTSVRERL